jgi:chemotaxis methyl-accepting protein methylase
MADDKSMTIRGVKLYLSMSRRIWERLPRSVRGNALGHAYGRHLHALVYLHTEWKQNHSTWFLRNRPELQLISSLVGRQASPSDVNLCVLACSKGAEVYSMVWALRSSHAQVNVRATAIDISQEIVEFAEQGVYCRSRRDALTDGDRLAWNTYRDQGPQQDLSIFDRLTQQEIEAMFVVEGDRLSVRQSLKEGITWRTGDASDPNLVRALGPQDIVVANRFLCHMPPEAAESCLRTLSRLVKPGGYLLVSGVDLDVRTRVAKDLKWKPIAELMRDVHEGDPSLTSAWPFGWYGLEPFRDDVSDWRIRYATAFQIGEGTEQGR